MKVGVYRLSMAHPGDASELQDLLAKGIIEASSVVAVIGKTEGNGGANDFTRALATQNTASVLAEARGVTSKEILERVAVVWSGGCEGVLSPHMTVFTRDKAESASLPSPDKRLVISVQQTRALAPEEVGRLPHVSEVASAVQRALAELEISPNDVHYVQVKGPLLTPAAISDAVERGKTVVTDDPNASKRFARGAMGLGVAVGLMELTQDDVLAESIGFDMSLYSKVASTSAGGEIKNCEVIVFGNSDKSTSDYKIGHGSLSSVLDIEGVRSAVRSAGVNIQNELDDAGARRVAAVFVKAEAPVNGVLWGKRTTMLSDADINYERHARAALGAVVSAVTHDPRIFVSGGTEHQCAPGVAPIAVIARVAG